MSDGLSSGLKGFDSYRVSLGDELRGERASLGKSLLDVQRELRIKAAHIDAIENAAPEAIPCRGYVTGYVRAYARYLGLDEAVVLRRFCEESGFDPRPRAPSAPQRRGAGRADEFDAVIAGSRLAAASRAAAVSDNLGAVGRAAGSVAVLAALIAGLGYGGWTLLENIQRVDFAPGPQAPEALAAGPQVDPAGGAMRAAGSPPIDAAALAAVYAVQEAPGPRFESRDGPISAIDPMRAGAYAAAPGRSRPVAARDPARAIGFAQALGAVDSLAEAAQPARGASPRGLALVFEGEAWVRVRNGAGGVVTEGLMAAGDEWRAPGDAEGLTLRAGNAGGVFVRVDGSLYGPLGAPGGVVSDVALDPASVRAALPRADRAAGAPGQRVAAR